MNHRNTPNLLKENLMTILVGNRGARIHSLSVLTFQLSQGIPVELRDEDGTVQSTIQFPRQEHASAPKSVWIGDVAAADLSHILGYVDGTAEQRAQVKWFDGNDFHNWF
jgi:hypothetical protein